MAVANSLAAVHERRAPGRMHHQRPGRARGQRLAGGGRHGGEDARDVFALRDAHRRHADRRRRRSWSPASPASRCSRTRRSSAPTPSRMSPASTRTACSRRAKPTRSCAPRTSAGAPTSWCWASSPGAMPSRRGWQELGIDARQRGGGQRRLRPLQGAGRQEGRDLRRGHPCAGFRRAAHAGGRALQACGAQGHRGDRRGAAGGGHPGSRRARAQRAHAWRRPGRRPVPRHRADGAVQRRRWCSTRSTRSPPAPTRRAK